MSARFVLSTLVFFGVFLAGHAAISPSPLGPDQVIHLRVAGSTLVESNGLDAGNIEAVIVHPQSGQVQFALVSLAYPSNRTEVTPVPWQIVQHQKDARSAGGMAGTFQQFAVPVSREALLRAPRVDSQGVSRTNDTAWMSTSFAYFAALGAAGGLGTSSGTEAGGAASAAAATPAVEDSAGSAAYDDGYWYGWSSGGGGGLFATNLLDFLTQGSNIFGTNFLTNIIGTNIVSTNAVGTNGGFNTNLFQSLTNWFATNFFNLTNRAGTNVFGTNTFPLTPFGSNFFRTNLFRTNGFRGMRTNAFVTPTNALPPGNLQPRFTNATGVPLATNAPLRTGPGLPLGTTPAQPGIPSTVPGTPAPGEPVNPPAQATPTQPGSPRPPVPAAEPIAPRPQLQPQPLPQQRPAPR